MQEDAYSEKTIRIRDSEYQKGNIRYALAREAELSSQLRQRYESCKKWGSEDQCRQIKASAFQECGHPLFRSVDPLHKGLFYLCFKCYPLYVPVSRAAGLMWTLKEQKQMTCDEGTPPERLVEAGGYENDLLFSGDITRSEGTERVSTMIANGLAAQGKYRILFLSLTEQAGHLEVFRQALGLYCYADGKG